MEILKKLSKLIKEKNKLDNLISEVINRPCIMGHVGEFIASIIFNIKLQPTATSIGIDGYFTFGNLSGKSVDIKWYSKNEKILDINTKVLPDYYLVMTGPGSPAVTSKGTIRPWLINNVYLFNSKKLVNDLKTSGRKIGIATSVRTYLWDEAEIYPIKRNKELELSIEQTNALKLFQ